MTSKPLRSGTALTLSLALALPGPLAAQTAEEIVERFGDGLPALCEAGALAEQEEALAGPIIDACVEQGLLGDEDAEALRLALGVSEAPLADDEAAAAVAEELAEEVGTDVLEEGDEPPAAVADEPAEVADVEEAEPIEDAEPLEEAPVLAEEEIVPDDIVEGEVIAEEDLIEGGPIEGGPIVAESGDGDAAEADAAELEPVTDIEADTTAETVTVDDSAAEADEVDAAEVEVADEEAAQAEVEAAEPIDVEPVEAEAPVSEEPAAEAPVDVEAAEAAQAESEPVAAAEEAEPAEEVSPDATAVEPEAADAATEEAPTAEVETEAVDPEAAEATEAEAEEAAEAESAEEAAEAEADPAPAAEEELEVSQEDTAESVAAASEAPVAEAARDAAEAPAPDAGDENVVTETVTEETARSSAEGFEERAEDGGDGGGLSDFEKALAAGLGALAVGAILNNGAQVVENTGDRIVLQRPDGELQVLKNDDELLRRPGSTVSTRRYDDGSTLTTVQREDGSQVFTIRAPNGQVLRRTRVLADGTEIVLFDDTQEVAPVDVSELQRLAAEYAPEAISADQLRLALVDDSAYRERIGRDFSLQQVRQIRAVRDLVPEIEFSAINFATGSAAIPPAEAEDLRDIGVSIAELIEESPDEVFLVEGHTDAVGSAVSNLALSDRRAESVALALTEYFDVPPENLVVQGYGESDLVVPTAGPSAENRRAAVRRITPLLRSASLN